MFYPQSMTELELIIPSKDLLAVTKTLAKQGVFHQVDSSYLSSEKDLKPGDSWQEKAAAYAQLERKILSIMETLKSENNTPPPAEQVTLIELDVARPMVEKIEAEVRQVSEKLNSEQKELEQLEKYLHQLEPVAGIDINVNTLKEAHYVSAILGIMPSTNVARLRQSLARIPFVLLTLRQDNRNAVVWVAGARRNADVLERAARSAYLNPLNLPSIYHGTPSEVIEAIHTGIQRARQQVEAYQTELKQLEKTHRQQLENLFWRVSASRILADSIIRFGRLQYTYLVFGWVPTAALPALSEQLKKTSANIIIETFPGSRSDNKQSAPVSLQSPKALSSFQNLVTIYARPRYEEVDPTLLLALTFPLLFGAMFGDVGHGLILALIGALLVSRKVPALRGLSALGGLIVACGLSATVFGFLYGSIFGVETVLPALWMRPMENILSILVVAIGAGVVLLSIGFLLGILNAWMARDWGRLFFDHNCLAGFILYWSLIGVGASLYFKNFPIPTVALAIPAAIAGLAVMFSEVLTHLVEGQRPLISDSPFAYAIQAGFELFETLLSFFSNSLSYVRVGAFAVAHAGLSAVVFILADLVSPGRGMGYWITLAIGNVYIIGFEGLIVGIQTMRLEYYEFFSKFFTGGGARYEPLTLTPSAKE